MMLRITRIDRSDEVLELRLEGGLTEQTRAELALCDEALGARRAVLLDVADVRFADLSGACALRDLVARGAVLLSCSPFLEEMLHGASDRPEVADSEHEAEANERDDRDLLAGLRAGSEAAFETLVRRRGGAMLAAVRRILQNEDDARDAVQEAFLAAFRSIASFGGEAKLSTWLHRIAVNAALMKLRTRRRRPEESIDDLLPRFDQDGRWVSSTAGFGAPTEALVESHEVRAIVRRCIDRLPDTYRAVLLLRDIEEFDTEETATMLGVTANAVKIRLHRARQALRTLLANELAVRDGSAAADPSSAGRREPAQRSAPLAAMRATSSSL